MKEIKVTVNTWYVVEGAAGATVINPLTNRAIATVEDGKQASFLATTPYVVASDDSVSVFKAPFNSAPAKLKLLGLLGGGSSTGLPSGYLEALFLKSNKSAKIDSGVIPTKDTGIWGKAGKGNYRWATADGTSNNRFIPPAASPQTYGYFYFSSINHVKYSAAGANEVGGYESEMNWMNSKRVKLSIPSLDYAYDKSLSTPTNTISSNIILIPYDDTTLFWVKISEGEKMEKDFVAVVDSNGVPCMFDKVTKMPFYSTGSFIVGFTVEQARKLSKLPAGGGTLTVSLPSSIVSGSTVTDSEVDSALATARAKGWNITVQTYTEEATAAASTYGMQRILVRKTQDENGMYTAQDGTRWQVDWCVTMYTPDDSTPDMHGYELFRSVEAATEYWGLEPYVDPAWEEELLTETENNEQE